MDINQEIEQLTEEIRLLGEDLKALEEVGNSLKATTEEIIDKVNWKGCKRVIRRILDYPKASSSKILDDNEGALTLGIIEKMKVNQKSLNLVNQINLRLQRLQVLNNKTGENNGI